MLKIISTFKEILCFPRQKLGWEVLGEQWNDIASRYLHKCCTVSGRLPRAVSLTVFGEGGQLKNSMIEQPVKIKGHSSILFVLRKFPK